MKKINICVGEKFGKLTVLSFDPKIGKDGKKRTYCKCACDCGNITFVRSDALKRTQSCGCLIVQKLRQMSTTHRSSYTRLYKIYQGIKTRCYRKSAINYYLYGKRGIKMCEKWKDNFLNFKIWALKNGYNDNLTIDRIDVNKDYCPENCRWVSMKEQGNNRRNNTIISYKGKTMTQQQWADFLGIESYIIYNRLKKGWSIEQTLTTPVNVYIKHHV